MTRPEHAEGGVPGDGPGPREGRLVLGAGVHGHHLVSVVESMKLSLGVPRFVDERRGQAAATTPKEDGGW